MKKSSKIKHFLKKIIKNFSKKCGRREKEKKKKADFEISKAKNNTKNANIYIGRNWCWLSKGKGTI